MRRSVSIVVVIAATACYRPQVREANGDVLPPDHVADVMMRSSSGAVLGTLQMTRTSTGLARIIGTLTGIPAGRHGIHLHAVGRCDPPSFETAGGHFNPLGRNHGLDNPDGPHAGDAPNIEADAAKQARVDITLADAKPSAANGTGVFDTDGSALVVHAQPDDQKTDPSGNSGARLACGVVRPR